ncbi:MAG: hypothetical protein IJ026_00325 [Candidatus Methanomethylophilaceae archaeon]|nr:hypothetical protein [Candidatus Methanomethylophilaceae archaeon]
MEGEEKTCGRCGHNWISLKELPLRCPSCGTYHWSDQSTTHSCAMCGHRWFSRSEGTPLRCPSCKTRSWITGSSRERKLFKSYEDDKSKMIVNLYKNGMGCVRISIDTGISVATVIDTVKVSLAGERCPRM